MKRNHTDYEEEYEDGEVIVREGDETREMYVVQSGEVVVFGEVNGREVALTRLKRGMFFGEMSLLESVPRSATVRAVGHTRVLVIKPGALLMKFRQHPTFALDILQQMSSRLRHMNQRLTQLMSSVDLPEAEKQQLDREMILDCPVPTARSSSSDHLD